MAGIIPKFQNTTLVLNADYGEAATVDLKPPEVVIGQSHQTDYECSNRTAVSYDKEIFVRVMTVYSPCGELIHPLQHLSSVLTARSGECVVSQADPLGQASGVLRLDFLDGQTFPFSIGELAQIGIDLIYRPGGSSYRLGAPNGARKIACVDG